MVPSCASCASSHSISPQPPCRLSFSYSIDISEHLLGSMGAHPPHTTGSSQLSRVTEKPTILASAGSRKGWALAADQV